MSTPIIYNLFPRLAGPLPAWPAHTARAAKMGFNWIMLNPVNFPGFSGSIYAVKDFFKLDPVIVPEGTEDPFALLKKTLTQLHDQGLQVMFDLVVNHTSKDAPLINEHPAWFKRNARGYVVSPFAVDPADSSKVTVWGDLAEVDNAHSPDREGLWAYWTRLVETYLDLGFDGFRCDAAYKVPAALWRHLTTAARRKKSDVLFAAETLGCTKQEVSALKGTGFDFLFNSSKWWGFDQSWAIDQHAEFQEIAPSIAFPESHDTKRLFLETKGLVQVQKQRYAFGAAFSQGILIPIGYEYCFRRRLHVVRTRAEQWEDDRHDISGFIGQVNRLKAQHPVLGVEGKWQVATDLVSPTALLVKRASGVSDPVVVVINKDWHGLHELDLAVTAPLFRKPARMLRVCQRDDAPPEPVPSRLQLAPAEVVYIVSEGSLA